MSDAQILIVRIGPRDGFVIAAMPGKDPYHSGERLVVGDVRRISPDGQAELWRAWLWPAAGGAMHVTRSCEAIDAGTPEKLSERLRKRVAKEPWWGGGTTSAGDPCPYSHMDDGSHGAEYDDGGICPWCGEAAPPAGEPS